MSFSLEERSSDYYLFKKQDVPEVGPQTYQAPITQNIKKNDQKNMDSSNMPSDMLLADGSFEEAMISNMNN